MNELEEQIFEAKKNGLTDQEIGQKFNVNLRFIEKTITKRLGVNISSPIIEKKIKTLQPKKFSPEITTVWSFKSRGNWATHNGNYRGNWSPYIPRNVILRFSKESDLVLDCFCGAGTTGVECKLTHRNFIGVDINPKAIELAKENINFPIYGNLSEDHIPLKINFKVGDARDLSFIRDESIDLICTHPPYADIIHYTDNQEQDLSFYNLNDFLEEMSKR
ncbi:MAG: methyltransferase domain-containing protein [Euryarchaeota archaeon]|nr:methyltransferase domain-containing protein [Euryarchaeota archaeon]